MAVNIAPQRRNAVQILSTLNIDKIMPLASLNDAQLLSHPLLHLCKRMPQVRMV
jgi:hypothetical protein